VHLPHDGLNANAVTGKRYVDHWRDAGFETPEPTPNQGRGAAMQRIEAARRLFPSCFFNDTPSVQGGLDALGFYHERKDEARNIGLGPEHDWSSHGADAFRIARDHLRGALCANAALALFGPAIGCGRILGISLGGIHG
jgi:phage terminase large subunit